MHRENVYKKIGIGLIITLIGIYVIKYSSLFKFMNYNLLNSWIIPILWVIIVIILYTRVPHIHSMGKLRLRSTVYIWAFNCGAVFIGVNLLAGFIQGFGKSPYNHNLTGILFNTFLVGTTLVGRESIRAYLVNAFAKKKPLNLYLIIGLMTLSSLNWFRNDTIQDLKGLTMFLSGQVAPEVFENILTTYLVLYGGPIASIIYLGMVEAFEWLCPILPDLNWLTKCVIGVGIPLLSTAFIAHGYTRLIKITKGYTVKEESLWQWLPTAILCIGWIWFTVGVFPIYPSAIATGSMEPMIYPGDVVIVDKVTTEEKLEALEVGDVIQFKRGDILINHRIIDIVEEEGQKRYETKGDNNSSEDEELVKMEDIKGTILHVIPKIGWPTLIFKSDNPEILNQVEF